MFSRTLEYALRAVAHLALRAPEAVSAKRMAEATKVPAPYLSKVLQQLRSRGIVDSQRGVGGGVRLSRPPEELTIWDVAEAVDPIERIRSCPLELANHGVNLCPLHRRMDDALALIEKTFTDTTLADLLSEPEGKLPLCPYPNIRAKTATKGTANDKASRSGGAP